jgi:hypothetical protein
VSWFAVLVAVALPTVAGLLFAWPFWSWKQNISPVRFSGSAWS